MKSTIKNGKAKLLNQRLPNGEYRGFASGYVIAFTIEDAIFELEMENGIRGVNIPVSIIVSGETVRIEI